MPAENIEFTLVRASPQHARHNRVELDCSLHTPISGRMIRHVTIADPNSHAAKQEFRYGGATPASRDFARS
jgi:hypothetical protein